MRVSHEPRYELQSQKVPPAPGKRTNRKSGHYSGRAAVRCAQDEPHSQLDFDLSREFGADVVEAGENRLEGPRNHGIGIR